MHIDDIAKKLYLTLDRNGDLWHLLDPAARHRYTSAARIVLQEAEHISLDAIMHGWDALRKTPLHQENVEKKDVQRWLHGAFTRMLRAINGGL